MDQLRARAFMDLLLGTDSRPLGSSPDGTRRQDGTGGRPAATARRLGPREPRDPAPTGPLAGVIPPGFAGRVTLTIPATTLLGLADRPGEMGGIGPIDPDLARDLAAAAARSPRSTWCVTVTDRRATPSGTAAPGPHPPPRAPRQPGHTRRTGGPDPPGGPRFTFTPADQPGPPGGYGTWRFSTGIPGQRDLLLQIGPIPTGDCDHRHAGQGPRSRGDAAAPGPGPARHVHRARLPPAGLAMRFRAQRSVRGWRQNVSCATGTPSAGSITG